ncbi:hypothetical protein GGI21_005368, partial [Coemansia aciculifera]
MDGNGTFRARTSQIPLLEGVRLAAANREILQIVASNIDAFSADHQQLLLKRGLVRAIALSADRDIVSVLPLAMAGTNDVCEEQLSSVTESEKLVQAVAVCATKVANPTVFGLWESGALVAITQLPSCSLGAWAVAEAWIVLAKQVLSSKLVLSTVIGVLETQVAAAAAAELPAAVHQLVAGLVLTRSDGERARLLAEIGQRFLRPNDMARTAGACALLPWLAFDAPDVVCAAARKMVASLGKGPASGSTAAAALAALAPAIAKQKPVDRTLVSDICNNAYSVLERYFAAREPDTTGSRVVEELLLAVSRLPIGNTPHAGRLLDLCARNLECRALTGGPRALVRLSQFIGVFTTAADLGQPSALPVIQRMSQVTVFLLDDRRPWLVRHAAYLLIFRFATECEADAAVIEMLVPPGQKQAEVVNFIQRVPMAGGDLVVDAERRRTVYANVFDRLVRNVEEV